MSDSDDSRGGYAGPCDGISDDVFDDEFGDDFGRDSPTLSDGYNGSDDGGSGDEGRNDGGLFQRSPSPQPPPPPPPDTLPNLNEVLNEAARYDLKLAVDTLWKLVTELSAQSTYEVFRFRGRFGDSTEVSNHDLDALVRLPTANFNNLEACDQQLAVSYLEKCLDNLKKLHRAVVVEDIYEGRSFLFCAFLKVIYSRDIDQLLAMDSSKKGQSFSDLVLLYDKFIDSLFSKSAKVGPNLTEGAKKLISSKGNLLIQPEPGFYSPAAIHSFFSALLIEDLELSVMRDVLSLLIRLLDGQKKFVIPEIRESDGRLQDEMVNMTILKALQRLVHFPAPGVYTNKTSTTKSGAGYRIMGNTVDSGLMPIAVSSNGDAQTCKCGGFRVLLTQPVGIEFKNQCLIRDQFCVSCTIQNPSTAGVSQLNERVATTRKRKVAGEVPRDSGKGRSSAPTRQSRRAKPPQSPEEIVNIDSDNSNGGASHGGDGGVKVKIEEDDQTQSDSESGSESPVFGPDEEMSD